MVLGIGYGNAKQFLNRLNNYGVSREVNFTITQKDIAATDVKVAELSSMRYTGFKL